MAALFGTGEFEDCLRPVITALSLFFGLTVESVEFNASSAPAVTVLSDVTELSPLETIRVRVRSIPSDAKFLLFAAHHQQDQLTLSFTGKGVPRKKGDYVTGRDIGLVVYVSDKRESEASVWLTNDNNQRIKVLITVSWHLSTGK